MKNGNFLTVLDSSQYCHVRRLISIFNRKCALNFNYHIVQELVNLVTFIGHYHDIVLKVLGGDIAVHEDDVSKRQGAEKSLPRGGNAVQEARDGLFVLVEEPVC